jgi:hypothetical protein
MNPRKTMEINVEFENPLNEIFIYPFPLMEWVYNPIPVDNKEGTIYVFMYFRDLNKAYPKENFLTIFIDQILDYFVGSDIFLFMVFFLATTKLKFVWKTMTRQPSYVLGVRSLTGKCCLVLKMLVQHSNGSCCFPFMT